MGEWDLAVYTEAGERRMAGKSAGVEHTNFLALGAVY